LFEVARLASITFLIAILFLVLCALREGFFGLNVVDLLAIKYY